MDNAHQEHAKVFKALCDPKRLAILSLLYLSFPLPSITSIDDVCLTDCFTSKLRHLQTFIVVRVLLLNYLKGFFFPQFKFYESLPIFQISKVILA